MQLKINGQVMDLGDIDPSTPLLWALRDTLGLVGTKYGCGVALCGACTVHVDGVPQRSCQLPVEFIAGSEITTIEGLASEEDSLTELQQAWIDFDVPQCGYCQAGQLMSAAALLKDNPRPSDDDISAAMAGNYCRCGTYNRIAGAIKSVAEKKALLPMTVSERAKGE